MYCDGVQKGLRKWIHQVSGLRGGYYCAVKIIGNALTLFAFCGWFTVFRHSSVNACLMPVLATDGCHVTTVEGIGTVKNDNLHPVQQAMVDMHGSQCGKCE